MSEVCPKFHGIDLECFLSDVDRLLDTSFQTVEEFQSLMLNVVRQYSISRTELEHEDCLSCKWKFECLSGERKKPIHLFYDEFDNCITRAGEDGEERGQTSGQEYGYEQGYERGQEDTEASMRDEIYNEGYEEGVKDGKHEAETNGD